MFQIIHTLKDTELPPNGINNRKFKTNNTILVIILLISGIS